MRTCQHIRINKQQLKDSSCKPTAKLKTPKKLHVSLHPKRTVTAAKQPASKVPSQKLLAKLSRRRTCIGGTADQIVKRVYKRVTLFQNYASTIWCVELAINGTLYDATF